MKMVAAMATLKRVSFLPKVRPDQVGMVINASREGEARGMWGGALSNKMLETAFWAQASKAVRIFSSSDRQDS